MTTAAPFLLLSASAPTTPQKLGTLTVDRQIFRLDGEPWQWLGCSAFPLCHVYETQGPAAVDAFIDAYPGVRVLRVWDYVGSGWGANAWDSSPADVWIAFVRHCNARGVFVEVTLLTDDDTARIEPAKRLCEALSAQPDLAFVLEGGNEPNTHKSINTHALIYVMQLSGRLWSTGDYEYSVYWRGTHGTFHPARTNDFARRAHDAYEYFHGGGPNNEHEPATGVAWVNDEPAKLADVPRDWAAWRSHIAASLLFGSGITIHTETGKFCRLPTDDERQQWALAVEVLGLIAPDAALGAYRRIPAEHEPGQTAEGRTYVVGNYMVRCQQKNTGAPEPGWTALDNDGVLFRR